MRTLNVLQGGYWRVMDRLLDLQNEAFTLGNAPFANLGVDIVLSGCAVTNNNNGTVNIAAGLIYVGGSTLRFDGAVNIASNGSQTFIAGPAVTSAPKPFGDQSTKNIYSEIKAIIAAQDPNNITQIKIGTTLFGLQQYITSQIYASEAVGTVKVIKDLDGTFASNFDANGNGVKAPWINWAFDKDSAGKVIVTAGIYTDPISGQQTTYNYADTGGEILHKLAAGEASTPAGLPPGLDGPHKKPEDGGGENVYYVSGPLAGGSTATTGHNNMQPYIVYYRVVKVA